MTAPGFDCARHRALRHGRRFLGIELSPAYAETARQRCDYAGRGLKDPAWVPEEPEEQGTLFEEAAG